MVQTSFKYILRVIEKKNTIYISEFFFLVLTNRTQTVRMKTVYRTRMQAEFIQVRIVGLKKLFMYIICIAEPRIFENIFT